jgi:hypothetical protein
MSGCSLVDELLRGAIDMHCHAYPEFSVEFPCRYTPAEHIELMRQAGMGGVVLKSHFWPTVALAEQLKEQFPDFLIVSSVTLNDCVGGLSPWAVEAAARQRAKVVWMPTWSARNDVKRAGISKTISKYLPTFRGYINAGGHALTDGAGQLRPEAKSVLEVCRDYDMTVCTGHIAPEESLALARCAADIGLRKVVLSHPDSGSVRATLEQIEEFTGYGGYIELCALGLTPIHHRVTPEQMARMAQVAGVEQCILSTDYFFAWDASSPEQLRGLLNALLFAGLDPEALRAMSHDIPRRLLGLDTNR